MLSFTWVEKREEKKTEKPALANVSFTNFSMAFSFSLFFIWPAVPSFSNIVLAKARNSFLFNVPLLSCGKQTKKQNISDFHSLFHSLDSFLNSFFSFVVSFFLKNQTVSKASKALRAESRFLGLATASSINLACFAPILPLTVKKKEKRTESPFKRKKERRELKKKKKRVQPKTRFQKIGAPYRSTSFRFQGSLFCDPDFLCFFLCFF